MTWSNFRDRIVPTWLRAAWIDPVWSKVIANGIIVVLGAILGSFLFLFDPAKNVVKLILLFKIPVYFPLAMVGLYIILSLLLELIRPKMKGQSLWNEMYGDYSFWNLYSIMSSKYIGSSIICNQDNVNELSNHNLLLLFFDYAADFSAGVTSENPSNDGRFGFLRLAPALMPYKLVELENVYNENRTQIIKKTYKYTELGLKFYASLAKVFDTQEGEYNKIQNNMRGVS